MESKTVALSVVETGCYFNYNISLNYKYSKRLHYIALDHTLSHIIAVSHISFLFSFSFFFHCRSSQNDSMSLSETSVTNVVTKEADSNNSQQVMLDIEPKFVFGVSGNPLYSNDNVIVFSAAGVIVVHDLENHTQRFIPLTGTRKTITAVDLNSIKYYSYTYHTMGQGRHL